MYFDPKPKTEKKDLFSMEYALKSLSGSLSDNLTRLIVIKGLRRTGKTSLLNVTLNEFKEDSIKIDVRESPYYDKKEFLKFLVSKIKEKVGESFLNKILKSISGVEVGYKDFSATLFLSKEENLMLFLNNFNKQLMKKNKKFILAFDEAQLLKEINFDYILASIFDNYPNIKLVLTGSEVGLLDKFLGKKDYNSPLFKRAYLEIVLKRMEEEDSSNFLQKGFQQIKKQISFNETRDVIENLDGIIGWLTYYGWLRYKGASHEKALGKTSEDGGELIKRELEQFLQKRKARSKYIKILRFIAKGKNSWNLIKESFRKGGIETSDTQLNLYLNELLDYNFIEKINEKYFISDPVTLKSIKA